MPRKSSRNKTKEEYQQIIQIIIGACIAKFRELPLEEEIDFENCKPNISDLVNETGCTWNTTKGYVDDVLLFLQTGDISPLNYDERNIGGSKPRIQAFLPENVEASLDWLEDMNPLHGVEEACRYFQCSRTRLNTFINANML